MKSISVRLPEHLANWLARRSKELGRSHSDLVREALEEQRQGKKRGKSYAELLADLGGFFEAPPGLSTNPTYLKNFAK